MGWLVLFSRCLLSQKLTIHVLMSSLGSECYSALDGTNFQTKVQGRSKKDKGKDQEWEIFPDDEETWCCFFAMHCECQ